VVGVLTWVNGAIVPDGWPALSARDHGVTVGDGVFETVKVLDGVPFALTRHLQRLERSAAGLSLPIDLATVRAGVETILDAAARTTGPPRARLRMTVTGGPGPLGSNRGESIPTVIVALSELASWPATAEVVTVPWTRNERAATVGLKTISYADNVVALAYAHAHGAAEAVFANTRGMVCEGTGSNVFVGIGGRLVTPPLDSGPLPGITRELLLLWLGDVEEGDLPIAALADADEVFLASSTRDVQPVACVDGRPLSATPGPLTARAAEVFAARAGEDPDP